MKKFTATCPICNELVMGADSQAQLNRNMGLHKRNTHGITGTSHSVQYKLAKQAKLEQKRLYQQKLRQKKYNTENVYKPRGKYKPRVPESSMSSANPVALPECPICHARFYAVRGE